MSFYFKFKINFRLFKAVRCQDKDILRIISSMIKLRRIYHLFLKVSIETILLFAQYVDHLICVLFTTLSHYPSISLNMFLVNNK